MNEGQKEELFHLIHNLRDAELNESESRRVEELVADDAEAMRLFTEHRLLEAHLNLELAGVTLPELVSDSAHSECGLKTVKQPFQEAHTLKPAYRRLRLRASVVLLTVACAAVVLLAVSLLWTPTPPTPPSLPTIVELDGKVNLIDPQAQSTTLQVGDVVPRGHTVHTGEEDSSVVIRFADSTTLQLNSNSAARITLAKNGRKRVFLSSGVMVADVVSQPENMPMVITTPHATVRVLGTRLISTASETATRVELEEGEVEFTRHADGQSVLVQKGTFAEASTRIEPLVTQPLPRVLTEPQFSIDTEIGALAYHTESQQLITANRDRISFWAARGGDLLHVLNNPLEHVREIGLSADGAFLAIGGHDRKAAVVAIPSGKVFQTFPSRKMGVRTIAIAPDGRRLAYVDMDYRKDESTVWVYEVESGEKVRTLRADGHEVVTLAFSPNGKILAGGTRNGKVFTWDVKSGQPQTVWPGRKRIRVVRFSSDGSLLASCDHRGVVRVWHAKSWTERIILQDPDRDLPSLAISPDNRWLAVGTQDGRVRIWNLASGEEQLILRVDNRRQVRHLVFASNNTIAASCGWTYPLTIWDVGNCLSE